MLELDHARLTRPNVRATKSNSTTNGTTNATIAPIDVPSPVSPNRPGMPQPSPASTPASALARALNLASKKLFGTSASSHSGSSAGPAEGSPAGQRRQILLPTTIEPDPEEEHLLGTLEDLAQKAETISAWADTKYTVVASRPSKPIADPARFARAAGESAQGAETRRKQEVEIEMAAVTAIGLYMAVMSFATGAIVIARRFLDGREGVEVSAGFDEGECSVWCLYDVLTFCSAKMVQGYVSPFYGAREHTEALAAKGPCYAANVD